MNNLKEAVPCAHTSKDDAYFVATRALCAITLSDYDTKFTDESKEVLQVRGLPLSASALGGGYPQKQT